MKAPKFMDSSQVNLINILVSSAIKIYFTIILQNKPRYYKLSLLFRFSKGIFYIFLFNN
jgi:hypothetical protein